MDLIIRYDPEADVLAVKLREGAVADEELLNNDAVVGYDREGRVVYVEVLDASKKGLASALARARALPRLSLRMLLERLEEVHGVELPESIVDALVDWEQDLLFVRFKEPSGPEVGEPLPTRAPAILFTDERTGEVTALEVIGLSELLKELERPSSKGL